MKPHLRKLNDLCIVEYGTRVVRKNDQGSLYPVYGGGGETFRFDSYNREDRLVVARFGLSERCTRFVAGKFFLNDSGLTVSPKDNRILDQRFLDYQLMGHNDTIYEMSRGTAQRNLDVKAFRELKLTLPSFDEQTRIVAVLKDAFAGIDAALANAKKNLGNARELFERHLDSQFAHAKEKWPQTALGSISERVSVGHVGSTSEFYCSPDEGIPFVRSQNVRPGMLDLENVRYVTHHFHAKLKKSKLRAGDLLFVRVGANRGNCCFVPEEAGELNCANIVFARPRGHSIEFLEYYCRSATGQARLLGMTTGSAQGVINTRSVAKLVVPTPPLDEQLQISGRLNEISADTRRLQAAYERKLVELAYLKQSILQKAVTGELTAKKDKREFAAP